MLGEGDKQKTDGSRVGSEHPPVVCVEGLLFSTCMIWIASMHTSRPVLRSYFVREARLIYNTYHCVPQLDVKVWSVQQKRPLTHSWMMRHACAKLPDQCARGQKSCHFGGQRSTLFCSDDLLCNIITVLPCWTHLPFLLCFFLFAVYTNVLDA